MPQGTRPQKTRAGLPVLSFADDSRWEAWLAKQHAASKGLWLRIAKKGNTKVTVTYEQALLTALCYGWIDGQKAGGENDWLQKFTPRGPRSVWSKVNRERVAALEKARRMQPAGKAAVERAKQGGQWDAAYDSPKGASVPEDFQAELDKSKSAADFFVKLNGANRYAILWRIQTAKKPETRAKRIRDFIAMLKRKEALHP